MLPLLTLNKNQASTGAIQEMKTISRGEESMQNMPFTLGAALLSLARTNREK